jgi:chorismate mutase
MGKHRALISDIDFQLISLLSSRMKISEKIGTLKKQKQYRHLPTRQMESNYRICEPKSF